MSLQISKLENVRVRGKKTKARCPACAESGHDRRGEHLIIDAEGRFGCVVYPGRSHDATAHRKQIFTLCGCHEIKPLCVHPKGQTQATGRIGRAVGSQKAIDPLKTGLLGRLGRVFESPLEPSGKIEQDVSPVEELSDKQRGVLAVLKPVVTPNRPLTERELCLLRRAGAENDPIILEALNLFNATIVE